MAAILSRGGDELGKSSPGAEHKKYGSVNQTQEPAYDGLCHKSESTLGKTGVRQAL